MPENTAQQPNSSIQEPKCPEFARYATQEIEAALRRAICLPVETGDARKLAVEVKWLQCENYARLQDVRAHERRIVQLEKELYEARYSIEAVKSDYAQSQAELRAAERERDSALADFKNAQNGCDALLRECEGYKARNADLCRQTETLRRKRDGVDGFGPLACKVENLGHAFELLIEQMETPNGFYPAALRARLQGDRDTNTRRVEENTRSIFDRNTDVMFSRGERLQRAIEFLSQHLLNGSTYGQHDQMRLEHILAGEK